MSLKDNFNQAVKDLLKRDGLVGSDLSKGAKQKTELDRYLDAPSAKPAADIVDPSEAARASNAVIGENDIPPMPAAVSTMRTSDAQRPTEAATEYSARQQQQAAPPPVRTSAPQPLDTPYFETEETTIISRNTIIDGNIRSFANINVEGSVKGDVQITKNANLSGKVVGDLECNNATMLGSSMQGNVNSKGQVKMDRDSLILGDINAQYLDLNGKIKGNIEVGGKAEFKTDAIIFGNINASTITVLDGATIQGFVKTTFLQEASTTIFPEGIAVSE